MDGDGSAGRPMMSAFGFVSGRIYVDYTGRARECLGGDAATADLSAKTLAHSAHRRTVQS
ncbi:unnamed protein product, partial [Ectocarpus sp. 13 AM-2016]